MKYYKVLASDDTGFSWPNRPIESDSVKFVYKVKQKRRQDGRKDHTALCDSVSGGRMIVKNL